MASAHRSEERCAEAGAIVVRDVTGTAVAGELEPALDALRAGCTETRPVVVAAGELARAGREREATPLARQAVLAEPANPGAWVSLFLALRRSDPAAAGRARARVLELNPRAGR